MGKTIESPIRRWSGHIVLRDPLPFPAYLAWRRALDEAGEARAGGVSPDMEAFTIAEAASIPEVSEKLLPGICACIEEWHLEALGTVTPETFPATPRRASVRLLAWLLAEITALVTVEETIPNA